MVDIIDFRNDQSGVSPVIGVILMVAVTVIIAAVIGSSALGLSDEVTETPPSAQMSITLEENYDMEEADSSIDRDYPPFDYAVSIEHTGGEEVDTDNIKIKVNGEDVRAMSYGNDEVLDGHDTGAGYVDRINAQDEFTAGTSVRLIAYGAFFNGEEYPRFDKNYSPDVQDQTLIGTYTGGNDIMYDGSNWISYGYVDEVSSVDDFTFQEGDTISVVWQADGDSSSTVLAEKEI